MLQVSAAMAARRQFIVYRVVPSPTRPGKTDKFPLDWRTGQKCNAHDPAVWCGVAEASTAAALWGDPHGVGFVFTPDCRLWFLDIDECLQPGGQWSPVAQQLAQLLAGCAVEVSHSGRGLHVFGSGALPPHGTRCTPHGLELYHEGRFVALTGTGLQGDAATVVRPEVLQWLVDNYFPPGGSGVAVPDDWRTEPVPEWHGPTDDAELVARLLRQPVSAAAAFAGKASFRDLWENNEAALARTWPSSSGDAYDRSIADAALASHLAWATGNNHERMRSLMLRSGLVREKWTERGDYLPDTVRRMAARTTRWLRDANGTPAAPAGTAVQGLSFTAAASGAIPATLTNVQGALRSQESTVRLAYDQFRGAIVLGAAGPGWRPLEDVDYVRLRTAFEERGFKPVSSELMRDAVLGVAMSNPIDTGIEWGNALQWDGVPRVDDAMVRYFGATPSPYATAVGRYLFTALAGRLLAPGCQVDMVPVLIGPEGLRKSSAVAALAPYPEAFQELHLDKLDADTSRQLRGCLVGELAELKGIKTADAQAIRAWITKRNEVWVPKYREFGTRFPRRCVFIGTSNPRDILNDPEGHRRWLPQDVTRADDGALARDREQLWAEGVVLWRTHGVLWSDAQTLARGVHADYLESDEWEAVAAAWLERTPTPAPGELPLPITNGQRGFQLHELARGALGLGVDRLGMRESKRLGAALRKLGYDKRQTWTNGVNLMKWHKIDHPTG